MAFDYRIFNQPIGLEWAGWRTNTLELGDCGWEISVDQDIRRDTMQIAINHPKLNMQGLTEITRFYYEQMMRNRGFSGDYNPTALVLNSFAREVQFRNIAGSPQRKFIPIDHRQIFEEKYQIKSLNDLAHFQTRKPKHEIYLKEPSIHEILEMALSKQEPEQARIRQEMLKRDEIREYQQSIAPSQLHTELRLVA